MGQATADLPDPLAASANGSNSTDDLLAQLAGEEIERLLAETETTSEPQPTEPPAAAIGPPGQSKVEQPKIIAAPAAAPADAAKVVPPEAPPTAAPAEDLESIFTQLDEREKSLPAAPAAKVKSPEPAHEEPSVAEALAAEMAEDAAQHARPMGGNAAPKAIDAPAVPDSSDGEAKPSLILSLLAMLSSPLDAFSDEARDLIGKAAILTMLNALCVLAYVIFFRR